MKKIITLVAAAMFVIMASYSASEEKRPATQGGGSQAGKTVGQTAASSQKETGYAATGILTDALAGGTVGRYTVEMKMTQAATNKEYAYAGKTAKELHIESTRTAQSVKAGGQIDLVCTYILLSPSQEAVKLTEVKEIYYGTTLCGSLQVKLERKGGKYESRLTVSIPKSAKEGIYTVRYVVESDFSKDSRDAIFTVE